MIKAVGESAESDSSDNLRDDDVDHSNDEDATSYKSGDD